MDIWLVAAMCLVGALAYRSATYIFKAVRDRFPARVAMPFSRGPAHAFLTFYVIAGLPIAFLNGYLIRLSWIDCLVVGVGTWLGMLVSIFVARRFNPAFQFYFFASVSLIWLCADLVAAVARSR